MADPKDDAGEKERVVVERAVNTVGRQFKEGNDPKPGENREPPKQSQSNRSGETGKPQETKATAIKEKGARG